MDKGPNGTIEKFPARKNNDFMIKVLTPLPAVKARSQKWRRWTRNARCVY